MILCPACNINPAVKDNIYGWINCYNCQNRQALYSSPKVAVEMVPESTKQDRIEHADAIEQPFREGVVNKRYIDLYGSKGIDATAQEIKQARDVYKENHYYGN